MREGSRTDGVSPFQAACTALSATVGTGNIAGVAGAVAIGGAGAVFWMWISAFAGMTVKVAEILLSLEYREKKNGEYVGGPMYYIKNGLKKHWHWLCFILRRLFRQFFAAETLRRRILPFFQ